MLMLRSTHKKIIAEGEAARLTLHRLNMDSVRRILLMRAEIRASQKGLLRLQRRLKRYRGIELATPDAIERAWEAFKQNLPKACRENIDAAMDAEATSYTREAFIAGVRAVRGSS